LTLQPFDLQLSNLDPTNQRGGVDPNPLPKGEPQNSNFWNPRYYLLRSREPCPLSYRQTDRQTDTIGLYRQNTQFPTVKLQGQLR